VRYVIYGISRLRVKHVFKLYGVHIVRFLKFTCLKNQHNTQPFTDEAQAVYLKTQSGTAGKTCMLYCYVTLCYNGQKSLVILRLIQKPINAL
jgi:hypothetical protein